MSLPTLSLSQLDALLAQPNLALIFWGDPSTPTGGNFWSDHPDYLSAGLTFFTEFTRGYNADKLSQYGVGIANICWFGPLVVQYPANGFQQIVQDAVAAGTLPAPDQFPYMMYVFVIDPTSPNSGFSNSKHGTFAWNGSNFPFAFGPFSPNLGVAAIAGEPTADGPTWWPQQWLYTAGISHEMYEVMTDPSPVSGWVDMNWPSKGYNSECCDICEHILSNGSLTPFQYGPWSIETFWSNSDNACVLGFASTWTNLGNPGIAPLSGAVALSLNALPGGIQLFSADTEGNLWTYMGNPPGAPQGLWTGGSWTLLAGGVHIVAGPPVAAFDPTTSLQEVFAVARPAPSEATQVWHMYQTSPDGSWSSGEFLGAPLNCEIVGNVSVGVNGPNPDSGNYQALEVFVIGSDGALHHIWQLGAWKGWSGWGDSLGSPPPGIAQVIPPIDSGLGPGPCVATNADGRLEVFVVGNDNNIWHRWQRAPNSGWSAWSQLVSFEGQETLSGVLACCKETNGCLAVFAYTVNGVIFYIDQTAPNNGWGEFTELQPMEISFASPPTASGYAQPPQLQLFAIGGDDALWTIQEGGDVPGIYQPWRFIGSPPVQQAQYPLPGQQIPAAIGTSNGFTVCVLGTDGNVWSVSQTGRWSAWGPLTTKTA